MAVPSGHTFKILPVLLENFTEKHLPDGGVQTQPVAGGRGKLAGGQAAEAGQASCEAVMNGEDFGALARAWERRSDRKRQGGVVARPREARWRILLGKKCREK
jgi:hypothetical protein